MNVNTSARLGQIRKIGLKRYDLLGQIPSLNKGILDDTKKEALTKVVSELLARMTLSDMQNLSRNLKEIAGIDFSPSVALHQQLIKLITQRVLLPDYIDDKDIERFSQETRGIIERYMKRFNKVVQEKETTPFEIELGDVGSFLNNSDAFYESIEERIFQFAGPFGVVSFGLNPRKNGKFCLEIPVLLAGATSGTSKEKAKNIDPKEVEAAIVELFGKPITKKGKGIPYPKNPSYKFDIENYIDREGEYGRDDGAKYLLITVYKEDSSDLMLDGVNSGRTLDILNTLIPIANKLINSINDRSPLKLGKFRSSYFVDKPYVFVEGDADESGGDDEKKFSKLLVALKEPVNLKDVGGQREAKKEVERVISAIKNPETMEQWGSRTTSGILFYGPAGTGKTLLARCIANEVGAHVYNIKMTDLMNSAYINEGPLNVKNLFGFIRKKGKEAKKQNHPLIVIFDEIDALLAQRGGRNRSGEDTKVVNTFLTEMSGFGTNDNVMFIGTTNNLDQIDHAVLRSGRFSTKIQVNLPDIDDRKDILAIHMDRASRRAKRGKTIFSPEINPNTLAEETDGFSGADIEEVLRIATEHKANLEVKLLDKSKQFTKEAIAIRTVDVRRAIKKVRHSNGKRNEILSSFESDALLGHMKDPVLGPIVREALVNVLTTQIIDQLNSGTKSGAVKAEGLLKALSAKGDKEIGFHKKNK